MKSTLKLLAVVAILATVSAFTSYAQLMPTGEPAVHAKVLDDGAAVITAQWSSSVYADHPRATVNMTFGRGGKGETSDLKSLYIRTMNDGTGSDSPQVFGLRDNLAGPNGQPDPSTQPVKNPYQGLWENFATQQRANFEFHQEYGSWYSIDRRTWKFAGIEQRASTEVGAKTTEVLHFDREGQRLTVERANWKSEVPKMGSQVCLGQWKNIHCVAHMSSAGRAEIDPRIFEDMFDNQRFAQMASLSGW